MTALEILNIRRESAKRLLAELSTLLDAPQYAATNTDAHYGHAGDMEHAAAKLGELVSFLRGNK